MKINNLIQVLSNKLNQNLKIVYLLIEDKTFLHESHKTHTKDKFHIKIIITSKYLKEKNKIESTKKIYKILEEELKNSIHSIQILIN